MQSHLANEDEVLKLLNFKKTLKKMLNETSDKNLYISAMFEMFIETVQSRNISKEEFTSVVSHTWDHCAAEKERLSRAPIRKRDLVKALFGDTD